MNWKTPLTLSLLVLVLVLGTVAGWHYATQDVPSLRDTAPDEPRTECRTFDSGQKLRASTVTVNVFNTPGGISGMAGSTLRKLVARGFAGGTAENSEQKVPGRRVLVTAAEPRSAQARLVRKHLKGRVVTRTAEDPDIGTAVNVYVGRRFRGLTNNAPTTVKVKGSTRVCYEVDE
jgi:hypothetical protein